MTPEQIQTRLSTLAEQSQKLMGEMRETVIEHASRDNYSNMAHFYAAQGLLNLAEQAMYYAGCIARVTDPGIDQALMAERKHINVIRLEFQP